VNRPDRYELADDRLHKDDVDGCHELLHQAMGTGEVKTDVAPLVPIADFDQAFRELCLRHGATASYVLAKPTDGEGQRLLSGGDAYLDGLVTRAVRNELAR
jgi:hypothetical protein